MSLLYSPYTISLVVSYLHLIGYSGILVAQYKQKKSLIYISFGFSQLMNLILVLSSLVALGGMNECRLWKHY